VLQNVWNNIIFWYYTEELFQLQQLRNRGRYRYTNHTYAAVLKISRSWSHPNDTEPEGPKTLWEGSKVWGGAQGRGVVGTSSESAFRRRAGARGHFHTRSLPLRPFTQGASGCYPTLVRCKPRHNFCLKFYFCALRRSDPQHNNNNNICVVVVSIAGFMPVIIYNGIRYPKYLVAELRIKWATEKNSL